MATATSNSLSLPSSSTLIDTSKAPRQPASASPQCVTLPTTPPPLVQSQGRFSRTSAYCRKIARNVVAMTTGEAPAAVVIAEGPAEVAITEMPEILKSAIDAWDKVEDKYAVTSLAVAGVVALWGSTGMISAIDRLPLIPGLLELVGIGYTGWFAYQNLVFKPDREALLIKIKETYNEIIGRS
ncbi:Protein CURVATURE THYLAKOID 1B, chloroplastic [Ancistrocladus abbreviatus]